MNFGSLHIVTAWRLTKAGVLCQGVVMDGPEGFRLVVMEDQQIVAWARFGRIVELSRYVRTVCRKRKRTGWVPWVEATDGRRSKLSAAISFRARRRVAVPHGLLAIAEQAAR